MSLFDQRLDQGDHFRDVLCGVRLNVRRAYAKCAHVLMVDIREFFCDGINRLAGLLRSFDDLVLDVGDVGGVRYVWVKRTQQARENIKDYGRPCVSYMGIVVNCRPADIHPHMIRFNRRKDLFVPPQ